MSGFVIEMRNISKIYPNGTIANNNVNFSLKKGEIHALLGENGAGKSTLMHILYGMIRPTKGEIFIKDKLVEINSPLDSLKHEIGMVHQHFMLIPSMNLAENLILGDERSKNGLINKKEIIKNANEFGKKYNFNIDFSQLVRDVSVGVCQKIEILKALYRGAKILILDEPTAVLTPQETKELFVELKKLKKDGHSIVFISHKLNEVKELCDRLTIMNSSKSVGVYNVSDLSVKKISEKMIGREVELDFEVPEKKLGKSILKVRNLIYFNKLGKKKLDNISFDVREGQILGIAAVEGNGASHLLETLAGLRKDYSGEIFISGVNVNKLSIKEIRKQGLRYVPADRMKDGVIKDETIYNNLIVDRLEEGEFIKHWLIDFKEIKSFARSKVKEFFIKCKDENSEIGSLSGGNIQKVVIAREFDNNPKLLIINQPTRGIDIGAAELIRKKMVDLKQSDSGILLHSADLQELMQVCDSIIILYKGEIVGYVEEPKKVKPEDLGYYMLGVKKDTDVSGVINE